MTESKNYFNTAATGLVPKKYTATLKSHFEQLAINAAKENFGWYEQHLPGLRNLLAEFCVCENDEVALIPNFSYGLNALIPSLKGLKRVLVYEKDYPSLIDPFEIHGFKIFKINDEDGFSIPVEKIKIALLHHKIEILALSHVQWLHGYKFDLNELGSFCREHQIVFIVDATQSLGGMRFSFKESMADVMITSNYKWMNSGLGTGILLARRAFLEQYHPRIRGNTSRMIYGKKWDDDSNILGYEPGHHNNTGLLILEQAVTDKLHSDMQQIEKHNLKLTDYFISGLPNPEKHLVGPDNMKNRSSIVALNGGELLHNHLSKRGFQVSMRMGVVRLSFHHHNTLKEIDDLLVTVAGFGL